MTERFGPLLIVVTLLVASLAGVVHAQSIAGGCNVPGQITKDGRWEHIMIPTFGTGPQSMTEYAVDPADPDRLYATNGKSVMVSGDGGCSWKMTFSLDDPPDGAGYSAADSTIVDLAVAPGHVLVAISQSEGLLPHVVLSSYSGETWRRGDEGLKGVTGPPVAVGITAADPSFAYLLVNKRAGSDDANVLFEQSMFESTTSGGSWGTRGGPGVPNPALELPAVGPISDQKLFTGMVADPVEGGRLFLYGPDGLYDHQAGVRSKLIAGDVSAVMVFRPQGSSATTVLAAERGSRTIDISSDGGNVFSTVQAPDPVDSFAAALSAGDYFMSAGGRVFLSTQGIPSAISPGGPAIRSLTSARSQRQLSPFRALDVATLYGRTDTTIERTTESRMIDTPAAPDSVVIGNLPPLDVGTALPGTLLPADQDLVLQEGEQRTIAYHLSIPPTPTPLDVFFDVDTTNSMIPAIDGLRAAMADIVTELATSKIDVWFGVGQYKAFEDPPAFQRLQDLSPPGDALTDALNKLKADGGGQETQLESLYQIATGEGSVQGAGIAPGQGATWRKGSLRIVINMTDEPISTGVTDRQGNQGGPFYHPTYTKVAAAMLADKTIHFGIAVQNDATVRALGAPLPGLKEISRVTGSMVPRGGVDCDGDDLPDLYSGEPLVCVIDHVHSRDASVMGGAIISVLRSIADIGDVDIVTRVDGPTQLSEDVALADKPVISGVNFKAQNEISLNVRFTCPSLGKSQSFPVTIDAVRAGRAIASSTATLTCTARPEIPPIVPPASAAIAVFPPLAQPNVPQQPNPNPHPNPNHNPAPQSQAQAQGALAAQEEDQPQVATVHETDTRSGQNPVRRGNGSEEYSMSRYVADKGRADALFLVMAVLLTISFGTGVALKDRPSPSFARHYRPSINHSRKARRYGR